MAAEFCVFVPGATRRLDLFSRQAKRLSSIPVFPHNVCQDVCQRLRVVEAPRHLQRVCQQLLPPLALLREGQLVTKPREHRGI